MISINTRISPNLKRKMSGKWVDEIASTLVDTTSNALLWNIQEYGFGSAKGNTPSGGSPIWQGRIYEKGHYRGYLRESHHIVKESFYHSKIVSSADFVEGVIEGYSTNWQTSDGEEIVFGKNYYHKRAVDKFIAGGNLPTIWGNIIRR